MKFRILLSALFVLILSAGISSKANANPWHTHYRHGGGPRVAVQVYAPPVQVYHRPVAYVYGPSRNNYYRHNYYGNRYHGGYGRHCAPRYYR